MLATHPFFELTRVCATEEAAIQFCREQGLIPSSRLAPPHARIKECWAICGRAGLNPAAPNCTGNVMTNHKAYKNGPKPYYSCKKCGKVPSQQHGLAPVGGAGDMTWFVSLDRAGGLTRHDCVAEEGRHHRLAQLRP